MSHEATLQALERGKTIKLCRINPAGSLYARKGTHGDVTFSWRFTLNGVNDTEVIGLWDERADPRRTAKSELGWTVTAAVHLASGWAREHVAQQSIGGFRAIVGYEKRLEEVEDAPASLHWTVGQLMTDYADYLDARVSLTAGDVRSMTRLHLAVPYPQVYNKPARDATRDDFIGVLQHINKDGHRRTSSKLRAYLHAAYNVARDAASHAEFPRHFLEYQVTSNPVSEVGNPKKPKGLDDVKEIKALNLEQLRVYWHLVKAATGMRGAVLRLHLLSGGPRPQQLVRLESSQVKSDHFILIDRKGPTGEARPHVIPFTARTRQALEECQVEVPLKIGRGPFALSTQGGWTHMSNTTLPKWAAQVVGDKIPNFELKHVRSGIETLLSRWRIDKQVRGRLQSHGISGVQDGSYDAYDFLEHKLECLELIEAILEGELDTPPVNPVVAQIREQRARRTA